MLFIRLSRPNNGIKIETSENARKPKANSGDNTKADAKRGDKNHRDDARKFEIYFKFQAYFNNILSHQTLAINRGENLKVKLNLKIDLSRMKKHDLLFIYLFFDSLYP